MTELNKRLQLKRDVSTENSLKKISNTDEIHGGFTTTIPCTVMASAALCPTLVCSNKCGGRG